MFSSGDEVGSFFSQRQNELYDDKSELKKAIVNIDQSISEVKRKIERVVEAISEGVIDINTSRKRMESLNSEMKSYEERKKSLEEDLTKIETDIDAVIELSSDEIIDSFPNHVRDYYKKFIKSSLNYTDKIETEYMNGKKFIVPHPHRHGRKVDPITVRVEWTDDNYEFVYTIDGPRLIESGVDSYDNYIKSLLDRAWSLVVESEQKENQQ